MATLFVRLRFLIILAWIGGTVAAVMYLQPIRNSGGGALGALVPKDAPALTAERISAQRFAFPILSRTIVVVRNPHGLPAARQAELTKLAGRLSFGHVAGFGDIAGALPLLNDLGPRGFVRERGTTMLLYLYFHPSASLYERTHVARRLVDERIGHRRGEYEGVTGEAPARLTRASVVTDNPPWVELATILLVAVAIAVHFRAIGASVMTIGVVAVAYLLADRLVAEFGRLAGVSVPAEVQPVLVALVFGVVTDYSIFFLSRFRALLRTGADRRTAAKRVVREISPIVAVAGITVAAGTAGLLAAKLQFLRAFGPGLAIAVAVAMVVAVTLVPAVLATVGGILFWPRRPAPAAPAAAAAPADLAGAPEVAAVAPRRGLPATRLAARHPVIALLVACAAVLGAATGLRHLALGNGLVTGLPPDAAVHDAYREAKAGFAAGVLAPAVVVVTGPAVGHQRVALGRLQDELSAQPGVRAVIGPRQQPLAHHFGAAISRDGDAARFALFLSSNPLEARAISRIRRLNHRLSGLLRQAGVRNGYAVTGGDTALSADTIDDTLRDLGRVAPTVLGVIFIVMALYLRALVAPLYLVLTSALGAIAALGITVYVLQDLAGYGQITYYVVFTVAVMLISLGSDYNVFLVGRIWREGRRRPLREAVQVAGAAAARPITTAGFVLAASFALLAIVPVRAFREIAFAMAVGLLFDALIVRTILVPALISLVGSRSAWPGHALKTRAPARD